MNQASSHSGNGQVAAVVIPPKKFAGTDWADRIKRARASREAAQRLREGKPISTTEGQYV